jgi:hypothetical protein
VPFWFGPRQLNQPVGAAFKREWQRKKPNRLNKTGILCLIVYRDKQANTTTTILASYTANKQKRRLHPGRPTAPAKGRGIIGFQ